MEEPKPTPEPQPEPTPEPQPEPTPEPQPEPTPEPQPENEKDNKLLDTIKEIELKYKSKIDKLSLKYEKELADRDDTIKQLMSKSIEDDEGDEVDYIKKLNEKRYKNQRY